MDFEPLLFHDLVDFEGFGRGMLAVHRRCFAKFYLTGKSPSRSSHYLCYNGTFKTGEVAERLNAPDSKSGIRFTVSRVQIPLSPPYVLYKSITYVDFMILTHHFTHHMAPDYGGQ